MGNETPHGPCVVEQNQIVSIQHWGFDPDTFSWRPKWKSIETHPPSPPHDDTSQLSFLSGLIHPQIPTPDDSTTTTPPFEWSEHIKFMVPTAKLPFTVTVDTKNDCWLHDMFWIMEPTFSNCSGGGADDDRRCVPCIALLCVQNKTTKQVSFVSLERRGTRHSEANLTDRLVLEMVWRHENHHPESSPVLSSTEGFVASLRIDNGSLVRTPMLQPPEGLEPLVDKWKRERVLPAEDPSELNTWLNDNHPSSNWVVLDRFSGRSGAPTVLVLQPRGNTGGASFVNNVVLLALESAEARLPSRIPIVEKKNQNWSPEDTPHIPTREMYAVERRRLLRTGVVLGRPRQG